MSKKKAFSGSTMTLKDFHGGSIPSDLPLPSAPGVVVRPSDRSQIQSPWGNPNNRFDYRSRPGSSGSTTTPRNFDDKAAFLTHPAHIGRNFDEDERKPLDGVSVPRRTVSDESIRLEPKQQLDSVSLGKVSACPVHSPIGNPVRFPGSAGNSQISGAQTGSVPNAWGVRKEAVAVIEPVPQPSSSTWSGPSAVSRFAQASALEKVSSGRWQSSKPLILNNQPNVDVLQIPESGKDTYNNNSFNGVSFVNEKSDLDVMRGRYVERNQNVEDEIMSTRKELMYNERARSPIYLEGKERNFPFVHDGVRPASTEGKFVGSFQVQPPLVAEILERPKLKLLPRSEASEPLSVDYKQGYQQPLDSGRVEIVSELYGNGNSSKPRSAGSEGGNQAVERPKLNLKPRSQPPEQSEEIVERERKSLFGGARPRELVLKERGVDDIAINNLDLVQSPNRAKHDHPRTEIKPDVLVPTPRHGDRVDSFLHDQRTGGRDTERRDHRPALEKIEPRVHRADHEKTEMRGSWRNENWRNSRGVEKQQQQQEERRHEPETWRKPIEPPKPATPDASGLQGKATSALELAQAFSRSKSDVKASDRVSGQRGPPGRNQIPFSRLTDTREFYSGPTPRHHKINGY